MKILIATLTLAFASSLFASISSEIPQKIGDNTYWFTINSDQSEKGKEWTFMTDAPPPLLPNEALEIARKAISKNKIADIEWEINSIAIDQSKGNINENEIIYTYYLVDLSEAIDFESEEFKKRIAAGNTKIAQLKIMITMDGEAIIPRKKD